MPHVYGQVDPYAKVIRFFSIQIWKNTIWDIMMFIQTPFMCYFSPVERWWITIEWMQEPLNFQALSTPMRFQKYAFSLSSQTHRFIRVHTTVLMRFRMSTRIKTIELHVDISWTLCARNKHTRLRYFLTRFRPFRGEIKTWHIIVESLPCVAKVLDKFNSYKSNNFH